MAVILHHFGPRAISDALNPGGLGVRFFFVLSGFLITGILVDARRTDGAGERRRQVGVFYLRRAVRILPAFYAVLALGWLLEPQIRRDWLWHATYLSNHYVIALGHWPRAISHAWSLAVEEQFYLVWPWVVLFVPDRWLGRVLYATCLVGSLSRAALFVATGSDLVASLPMTSSLDSLGIGACLAWRRRHNAGPLPGWVALAGLAGLLAEVLSRQVDLGWVVRVAVANTLTALLFAWIIERVALRARGTGWLAASPLVFLGTISYGVYLIHNLMPSLAVALVPARGRWIESHAWGPFFAVAALAICLATVSWYVLEQPLNRLKRRWSY